MLRFRATAAGGTRKPPAAPTIPWAETLRQRFAGSLCRDVAVRAGGRTVLKSGRIVLPFFLVRHAMLPCFAAPAPPQMRSCGPPRKSGAEFLRRGRDAIGRSLSKGSARLRRPSGRVSCGRAGTNSSWSTRASDRRNRPDRRSSRRRSCRRAPPARIRD